MYDIIVPRSLVWSLAKLRIKVCLSVRPSVRLSVSCPTPHVNNFGTSGLVFCIWSEPILHLCQPKYFYHNCPPCDLGGIQNLLQYSACGKKLMLQNQLLLLLLHPSLHWNKCAILLYASKTHINGYTCYSFLYPLLSFGPKLIVISFCAYRSTSIEQMSCPPYVTSGYDFRYDFRL